MAAEKKSKPFESIDFLMEVTIAAPRAKVWKALTSGIGTWWPKSFCTPTAKSFTLEPKLGGRLFEDWGDGGGMVWGTVILMKLNESLAIAGDSIPAFGGPGRLLTEFTLEDAGDGTKVRLRESGFGALSPDTATSLDAGWQMLLGSQMKALCEGRDLPEPAIG